jgi:hypothetical protein
VDLENGRRRIQRDVWEVPRGCGEEISFRNVGIIHEYMSDLALRDGRNVVPIIRMLEFGAPELCPSSSRIITIDLLKTSSIR